MNVINNRNIKVRIIAIALSAVAAFSAVGIFAGCNAGASKAKTDTSTVDVQKKYADYDGKIKQMQAELKYAAKKSAADKIAQLQKLVDQLRDIENQKNTNDKKWAAEKAALEKTISSLKAQIKKLLEEKKDPTQPTTAPSPTQPTTVPAPTQPATTVPLDWRS